MVKWPVITPRTRGGQLDERGEKPPPCKNLPRGPRRKADGFSQIKKVRKNGKYLPGKSDKLSVARRRAPNIFGGYGDKIEGKTYSRVDNIIFDGEVRDNVTYTPASHPKVSSIGEKLGFIIRADARRISSRHHCSFCGSPHRKKNRT